MDNAGHDGELFVIVSAIVGVHSKMIVWYDQASRKQTISQKARVTFQKRLRPYLKNATNCPCVAVPPIHLIASLSSQILSHQKHERKSSRCYQYSQIADHQNLLLRDLSLLLTVQVCVELWPHMHNRFLEISHRISLCKFVLCLSTHPPCFAAVA